MSASKNLIQAASGVGGEESFYDYEIENSIHLEPLNSGNPILSRTIGAGSQTNFTWSFWVKPPVVVPSGYANTGQLGVSGGAVDTALRMTNNLNGTGGGHILWPYSYNSSYIGQDTTTSQFRDPSAWYHVVWAVDTTNATEADRSILYVNGVRQPFSQMNAWTLNGNTGHGTSGYNMYITRYGYMADVVLLDGTTASPTDFAEDKNGIWVPKEITGLTFGTNGFYLDFADSSALGNDVSGNNNDFTVSGLTSSDQMIDTPTNNFPTWNPLLKGISQTGVSTSDGNMVASHTGGAGTGYWPSFSTMTLPKNGKVYFEMCLESVYNGALIMGIMSKEDAEKYAAGTTSPTMGNLGYWDIHDGSAYAWGGDGQPDYATLGLVPHAGVAGGVVGFAIDLDAGKGWIRVNGTWMLSGDPANGTNPIGSDIHTGNGASASGEYVIWNSGYISVNAYTRSILNCGQDSTFSGRKTAGNYADENGIGDFLYSVPSGYLALCTANLPEPTIGPNSDTLSDEHFDIALWTGTGTTQNITSLEFQPDFVWMKARTVAYNNWLFDAVRGTGNLLASNTTDTETSYPSILSSFNSNGFTTDSFGSTYDFVAWNWKANGSGVSNTDGSITSTVSVNTDAGFSIAEFTMPASGSFTVGHGLGVAPKMYIVKRTTNTSSWGVWHSGLSGGTYYVLLDTNGAQVNDSTVWTSAPSSSVLNIGSAWPSSSQTAVAYCFAEVESFSSFGSYTGNGSADGPMIYTGMRPAYVMIKKTSGTGNWDVFDADRDTYNVVDLVLYPSDANAEQSFGSALDFLSNGFKLRSSANDHNASGGTYVYMAFAENPFKYANAR